MKEDVCHRPKRSETNGFLGIEAFATRAISGSAVAKAPSLSRSIARRRFMSVAVTLYL
jgi:hypothetical protein